MIMAGQRTQSFLHLIGGYLPQKMICESILSFFNSTFVKCPVLVAYSAQDSLRTPLIDPFGPPGCL